MGGGADDGSEPGDRTGGGDQHTGPSPPGHRRMAHRASRRPRPPAAERGVRRIHFPGGAHPWCALPALPANRDPGGRAVHRTPPCGAAGGGLRGGGHLRRRARGALRDADPGRARLRHPGAPRPRPRLPPGRRPVRVGGSGPAGGHRARSPASAGPSEPELRGDVFVDADWVDEHRDQAGYALLDGRPDNEYTGRGQRARRHLPAGPHPRGGTRLLGGVHPLTRRAELRLARGDGGSLPARRHRSRGDRRQLLLHWHARQRELLRLAPDGPRDPLLRRLVERLELAGTARGDGAAASAALRSRQRLGFERAASEWCLQGDGALHGGWLIGPLPQGSVSTPTRRAARMSALSSVARGTPRLMAISR